MFLQYLHHYGSTVVGLLCGLHAVDGNTSCLTHTHSSSPGCHCYPASPLAALLAHTGIMWFIEMKSIPLHKRTQLMTGHGEGSGIDLCHSCDWCETLKARDDVGTTALSRRDNCSSIFFHASTTVLPWLLIHTSAQIHSVTVYM